MTDAEIEQRAEERAERAQHNRDLDDEAAWEVMERKL